MNDSGKDSARVHAERMRRFTAAGLYLVTSRALSLGRSTPDIVAQALQAGARLVQLREKDLGSRELLALATELRAMTRVHDALLIVNDRLDIALACDADGVHLGQDDLPIAAARRIAPAMIIGASSHCRDEARRAEAEGASYVNIGPLFATRTKSWDRPFLGLDGLREVAPHVSIPFTVMGGIKQEHVPALVAAGVRTLAVVTAVTAADDPGRAAREFIAALGERA